MDIFGQITQILTGIFSKGSAEPMVSVSIPLDAPAPSAPAQPAPIDWTSPDCPITPHFTVSDACMLHSWNRLANEMDGFNDASKVKIVTLCQKMEEIRTFLGCPIAVHCMFRSQQYNQEVVKAIPNDVHAQALACDFDCNGHFTIDEVHAKLEPVLEQMGIRMERNTPTWVHIDLHPVGNARYFTA
jgi:Peptidase M15